MDNVVVVNDRQKITKSNDDNMGLDLQFIHNTIACLAQLFERLLWARNESN